MVSKFKELGLGVQRLVWVGMGIVIIIMCLLNPQDVEELVFDVVVSVIAYWAIVFTVLWILDGFKKKN